MRGGVTPYMSSMDIPGRDIAGLPGGALDKFVWSWVGTPGGSRGSVIRYAVDWVGNAITNEAGITGGLHECYYTAKLCAPGRYL